MKRKIAILLIVALILSFIPAIVVNAADTTVVYKKITTMDELTTGKYVMVLSSGHALTTYDSISKWVLVNQPTVSGNSITQTDAEGYIWDLTVSGTSVILTDSNGVCIKPTSTSKASIGLDTTGAYTWNVDGSNGAFTFTGSGSYTAFTLAANKSYSYQIRAYMSTTVSGSAASYPSAFTLYKMTEVTNEEPAETTPSEAPTEVPTDPPAPTFDGTFYKLTAENQLTTGKYVMVLTAGYAPTVLSGDWVLSEDLTVTGDTIANPAQAIVWDITVTDGTATLTDSNGVSITPTSASDASIGPGAHAWAVVYSDGTFQFVGGGDYSAFTLAANSGSSYKFRAYKSTTVSGNPNGFPSFFTLYRWVENGTELPTTPPTEAPTQGSDDFTYVYGSYGKYNNVIINWGTRGETATQLSPNAKDFYTDNGVSYSMLAALSGSSTVSQVPSSELYETLQILMEDAHSTRTSYDDICYLSPFTDAQQSGTIGMTCFYSGAAIGPDWDSGSTWNREHCFPKSKNSDGDTSNGNADVIAIRPTVTSINSSRGKKAYGTTTTTEYFNPNNNTTTLDVRGDAARSVLYSYVRWGYTEKMWGASGVIESVDVLLSWMAADPVDTWEMGRNDSVESITGTRNVFVDYPELAFVLFGEEVPANMQTPSSNAGGQTPDEPDPTDPSEEPTVAPTDPVVGGEAELVFDDAGKRTVLNEDEQVWVDNGITVTNAQGSSTSAVADYVNPVRFYKSSTLTVAYPGMTKIEFTCNGEDYAAALQSAIAGATVDGKVVTVTFAEATNSFTTTLSGGQVRMDSLKVYATTSGTTDPTDPTNPTEPITMVEIVDAAYALESGATLEGTYTLTGVITRVNTPFNSQYGNVTVTIAVAGREDKPIMCYRLAGEGADVIAVGDTITVTGTIKNYNDTVEFDQGCTLDSYTKGEAPENPLEGLTMQEIVDAAYALEAGSYLDGATLTGKITEVNTAYSDSYNNITVTIVVEGREDKPIECFRLTGEGIDVIAVGDTITVTGNLTNYQGTKIEFEAGCTLDSYVKAEPPVTEPAEPETQPTTPTTEPTTPATEPVVSGGYQKITTLAELTSGKYVLVVNTGAAMTVYSSDSNNWVLADTPTIDGDTITAANAEEFIWNLTVDGTTVTLQDANGVFIKPKAGDTNGIQSGKYFWDVTCTDGTFRFNGTGSDTTSLAYNNTATNYKFRAYKTSTISKTPNSYLCNFTLYKLTEGTSTEPEEDTILVGTSYSIHLVEPWALRAYIQFSKNTKDNLIPVSEFTSYGVYAIIGNKFEGDTAEELIADLDVVKYTPELENIKPGGEDAETTLMFDFYDGLYSFNLDESIYWVAYFETAEGIHYTGIQEKSLMEVANSLLEDSDVEESEKNVLTSMMDLNDAVIALRGEDASLGHTYAPGVANTNGLGNRNTGYQFGTSFKMKLIEPWGVRVRVLMRDKTAPGGVFADYENAEDYGLIFFHDKNNKYKGAMTAEQMKAETEAKVYSKLDDSAVIHAGGVTAVYDHEIYTYQLDSELYCLPYIVIDGNYYYPSNAICWNLLDEMVEFSERKDLDPKETDVFKAILKMYDNVQEHREQTIA